MVAEAGFEPTTFGLWDEIFPFFIFSQIAINRINKPFFRYMLFIAFYGFGAHFMVLCATCAPNVRHKSPPKAMAFLLFYVLLSAPGFDWSRRKYFHTNSRSCGKSSFVKFPFFPRSIAFGKSKIESKGNCFKHPLRLAIAFDCRSFTGIYWITV